MKDLYRLTLSDRRDAELRLTTKYGTTLQQELNLTMAAGAALRAVTEAIYVNLRGVDLGGGRPPADPGDCIAALTMADAAREEIDKDELVAIDGARALGVSWKEIGVALGHTAPTADRAARTRYGALRRRFSYYQPIVGTEPTGSIQAATDSPEGRDHETA